MSQKHVRVCMQYMPADWSLNSRSASQKYVMDRLRLRQPSRRRFLWMDETSAARPNLWMN